MLTEVSKEVLQIIVPTKKFIISSKMELPGAECGTIWVETGSNENSELLMEGLNGKHYEKNEIKTVCVPDEAYVDYYLKNMNLISQRE